ncbi:uncharacterized protein G2W53_030881 [Senna tora]|uniref:Uncharacterized protein n=1 Tax=Senna tora TaxID=362788 RepID=A0A834T7W2_9FABA|nr:uncharacterized protein G2W53_030881 [Senna tora]
MGDRHNKYYHHHHHQRSTFLPMLCPGPSMKDVSHPRWRNRTTPLCDDPVSPRIGCMGQVKRNNKIVGYPAASTTTASSAIVVKYSKLRKIFSAKNLTPPPHAVSGDNRNRKRNEIKRFGRVSIDEMDPPLPVIKREQQEREAESLWKRRSGGVALKSLQLQQIHHTRHRLLHPTATSHRSRLL